MSHSFKDGEGDSWDVDVNVFTIERVRSVTELYLPDLVKDAFKPMDQFFGDLVMFVHVVFVLCEKQAKERQLDEEAFARRFKGDTVGAAADAFVGSFADFFHDPKVRENLRSLFQKARKVTDLAATRLSQGIEKIDPENALQTFLNSATNSREPLELTPGH